MSGPLQAAGAQTDPTRYGALNMGGEQFTGIWTQRSPYRDAATAYLVKKFYQGSRFDSILDGINREISARLTDVRRPGNPVWNSNTFYPVFSWYSFKFVQNGQTVIRVLQDTKSGGTNGTGQIIDVTAGGSTVIWNKSVGAGRTRFLAVGPTLYMANGVDNIKWVRSGLIWQASTLFTEGQFIVDSNNNLQLNIGSQQATITNIQITSNVVTMFFSATTQLDVPVGTELTFPYTNQTITIGTNPANGDTITINGTVVTFVTSGASGLQVNIGANATATATALQAMLSASGNANLIKAAYTNPSAGVVLATSVVQGFTVTASTSVPAKITFVAYAGLTTVPALNGTTPTVTSVENGQQLQFNFTNANVAFSAETGTCTTGTGTSGATQPTWATGLAAITQDGGAQWENRGSSVQQWMYGAPANAPTVTQAVAPSIYPTWVANTWYAPLFVILYASNLYQLTTGGATGGTTPTFNSTPGATTTDGSAVWTCLGPSGWVANTAYAVGAVIQATFTYYITVTRYYPNGNPYLVQWPVNATCIFVCTTAGTSAATHPEWINGLGTVITESTGVVWINKGNAVAYMGASGVVNVSTNTQIVDSNQNLQTVQTFGESGSTHPTWSTVLGATTGDNATSWLEGGPYGNANTGSWIYAYSGWNSVTGDITTASPVSNPILQSAGNLVVVQGQGVQPTFDQIILWRTTQGDSTLIFDSAIPNPGPGQNWVFTDTTPDTGLNAEQEAPIADSNNPPPAGATAPVYHMGRVWIINGAFVSYSGGPTTLVGNGSDAFPPSTS